MILPAFLSLFLLAAGNQPAIASTPGGAAPGPASHGYDHDDGHEQMLGFGPGLESARANGRAIFNAVHDAMRQFGSSWHHNGMSVFPAVVPRGVLLYHGSHSPDVPRSHEWLAFEVEHAENFARSRPPRRRGGWHSSDDTSLKHEDPLDVAVRLQSRDWLNDEGEGDEVLPGYLHTYRTTRPLNLLYIDGMAAANTWYGTTDTQDLLLTYAPDRQPMEDYRRGGDLCEAFAAWGVEGFIRMEPGFEVIFCDFSPDAGLELASAPARQALPDDPAYADFDSALSHFEWVRAAAQRYRDIGAGRVLLDFSGMVSAYFYPVNLTNPDPERPELPRLVQATEAQLAVMRGHVAGVASRRGLGDGSEDVVDWQGVTDMIVARYVDRLPYLAGMDSLDLMRKEIAFLLNPHMDYSEADDPELKAARKRCARHYLQTATPRTYEDELIFAAIESTTAGICESLFTVRELLHEHGSSRTSAAAALEDARRVIGELKEALDWSRWKECGPCRAQEVCFIAMWPFGNVEDHFHPQCLNASAMWPRRSTYWPWDPPCRDPPCDRGPPRPRESEEVGEL